MNHNVKPGNDLILFIKIAQYAEKILNKIAKTINKTFTGLKFMLQGVQNIFCVKS